jgi:HSP20 family protein
MNWISALSDMEIAAQDMERLLRGWPVGGTRRYAYPQVNIWTNEDGAVITSEVPGIDLKDIAVEVMGNRVTVIVEIPERPREQDAFYIRSELQTGRFSRELTLPFKINAEKTKAEYAKGVLKIHLSRAEEDKPKKITIKAE